MRRTWRKPRRQPARTLCTLLSLNLLHGVKAICILLSSLSWNTNVTPNKQGSDLIDLRLIWRDTENLIFGWFVKNLESFLENFWGILENILGILESFCQILEILNFVRKTSNILNFVRRTSRFRIFLEERRRTNLPLLDLSASPQVKIRSFQVISYFSCELFFAVTDSSRTGWKEKKGPSWACSQRWNIEKQEIIFRGPSKSSGWDRWSTFNF